ncbi:Fc.00g079280.m01.CDS01 [Cosmosporella sp. VM-42]
MGGVASVPYDRTRSLRVIGAGYSRTGTLSMALALEKLLDGPVMHGGSQLLGREDAYVKLWTEIFDARHDKQRLLKLLREATAGFVAITDAPGNCFIGELLELYPDAEVFCVHRNRERWWKSWESVTKQAGAGFLNWFLSPVPGKRWYPKLVTQFLEQQKEKWGPMTDRRMGEHNEYVKEVTPPNKFHMMNLSEGWAPLCNVLGVTIPDEPFPRANDAEAVEGLAGQIFVQAGSRWAGILAGLGALGYGAWWLGMTRNR